MRYATKEEQNSVNQYVEKISKDTGINFFDLMEENIMKKLAEDFQRKHRNGVVSNITDYSFKFTTKPKNDSEKQKEVIYYISYFLKL